MLITQTDPFYKSPNHQTNEFVMPVVNLDPPTLASDPKYDTLSFRQELKLAHILKPTLFGTLRLSRNCVVVLLSGRDESEVGAQIDLLVSRRFARPHKDYFFFHFLTRIDTSHSNIVRHFSLLRYKHVIQPKYIAPIPEMAKSETGSEETKVFSYCGKFEKLFSHVCPGMIAGQKFELAASNTPALFRPAKGSLPAGGALSSAFKEIDYRYNSSTYIRHASYGGSAGMRLNNGTGIWKGTVGDVFDRDVNISIATGMTMERLRFTDFSVTHLWNERVFFIRSPPIRRGWFTIFRPLQLAVWNWTGITLFGIVAPVMYVCALFQEQFASGVRQSWLNPYLLFRVMDTIWCVVLEQTTFTRIWNGGRVRYLIILWTFVCLVVSTGYKTKLMNFLTFLDREAIPETHLDLSLSDYKLFFRNYKGIVILETRLSEDPMHKRFMARAQFPTDSFDCFTSALLTPKSACMDFILNGEYTLAVNTTLRRTGDQQIFIRSKDKEKIKWMIMWIFAKGSPLTATFDRIKLELLATGLVGKWIGEDWAAQKSKGVRWLESQNQSAVRNQIEALLDHLGETGQSPLEVEHVLSIFALLGFGLILGGIALGVEMTLRVNWAGIRHESCAQLLLTLTIGIRRILLAIEVTVTGHIRNNPE